MSWDDGLNVGRDGGRSQCGQSIDFLPLKSRKQSPVLMVGPFCCATAAVYGCKLDAEKRTKQLGVGCSDTRFPEQKSVAPVANIAASVRWASDPFTQSAS
jgi:hypothetical protein